jgi:Domain of unknown function (DUF4279)
MVNPWDTLMTNAMETKSPKEGKALVAVSILLRGAELDPAFVSKALGIEPTRAQKRGGFTNASEKFIAKIGVWRLKLASDTRSFESMIEELLERIGSPVVSLAEIAGVEDACLDLFIAWDDGPNEMVDFKLTRDQAEKLSRLGLGISFTVSDP